jgi:hypothetical protein
VANCGGEIFRFFQTDLSTLVLVSFGQRLGNMSSSTSTFSSSSEPSSSSSESKEAPPVVDPSESRPKSLRQLRLALVAEVLIDDIAKLVLEYSGTLMFLSAFASSF